MGEKTCSFAEMIPLFQELFEPDPSRLTALIGRVKNLLKLGATSGGRTGKGKAATYTESDVWELTVTMELTQIGLPPAKAIALYHDGSNSLTGRMQLGNGSILQLGYANLSAALERHLPRFADAPLRMEVVNG